MRLALIGENLSYSLSRQIHTMLFNNLKLDARYNLMSLSQVRFEQFMSDYCGLSGFNVTVPYKASVILYLDYISDEAKALNSVNTVVIKNNQSYGYNTDIVGFDLMMKKEQISFKNKSVIILGTGASARMIEHYAYKNNCLNISFVGIDEGDYNYSDYFTGDILINTTPVGMKYSKDVSLVNEEVVSRFETIIDINYNPYRTKLLRYGLYQNKQIINGLYMLVAQAVVAEEYFHDIKIDYRHIDNIYDKMHSDRNISLIGMMGCGKTTVGEILAKKLNMNYIDVDEYIETKTSQTIEQLFSHGEEYFRKIETEYLQVISEMKNTIIACGGGVVTKEANIDLLYQNGTVVYLERDLNNIKETISNTNRPLLSSNLEKNLQSIFFKREQLYLKYAEYIVTNNSTIEDCVKAIVNEVYL